MRIQTRPGRRPWKALLTTVPAVLLAGLGPAAAQERTRPDHGVLTPALGKLARPAVAASSDAVQAAAVSLPAHGPGSLIHVGDRILADVRFAEAALSADPPLDGVARVVHESPEYRTATVAVAPERLGELARVEGVEAVSEVLSPVVGGAGAPGAIRDLNTCHGSATSEGDQQLGAAAARSQWDIDGAGVKVGVISDSYGRKTTPTSAAGDVASGDLPGPGNPCGRALPVQVIADSTSSGVTDEGRAMAQIVHDLAPGSPLAFATAHGGELAFADNIRALRAAGAKVIVDDIAYVSEPFFQDGPVAVAVNDVTAAGVAYYSVAHNHNILTTGRSVGGSWEAPAFRNAGACPAGLPSYATQCMDFNPGAPVDTTYGMTVAPGGTVLLDLQWAQSLFGVATDLDAYLTNAGGSVVAASQSINVHGRAGSTERPFEFLSWRNTSASTQNVNLEINRYTGATGGDAGTPRLKTILIEGGGSVAPNEYVASAGGDVVGPTVFGHNGTAAAVTAAAVPYNASDQIESFSSRGPVTQYFGPVPGTTAAPPLATPLVIAKPDLAATDGGQDTFFGSFDGLNWRFYGTSAAAPHAAAVAALMMQHAPSATAAQVAAALKSTASPVGAFPASAAGAGLISAVAAGNALSRGLTIAKSGTGIGQVTSAPAGIACGPVCARGFGLGRVVVLRATPSRGSSFAGWSGAGCSGTGSCTITMDAAKTVTASFGGTPIRPDTTIDSGPSGATRQAAARFAFHSSEAGASFECSLDGAAFAPCSSPQSYGRARPGPHTFQVRSVGVGYNLDPSPASRAFFVDTRAPRIALEAKGGKVSWKVKDPRPSSGIGSQKCALDGGRATSCRSPKTYRHLKPGKHAFSVTVTDRAGNSDRATAKLRGRKRR
jgi:hypothetical protein